MPINNIYAMTDEGIAQELGSRIEQMRLEANISQEQLAEEVGITRKTYRNLINGNGKFQSVIAVLRALKQLQLVDEFIPEKTYSPMALLKQQGKKRKRASASSRSPTTAVSNTHLTRHRLIKEEDKW